MSLGDEFRSAAEAFRKHEAHEPAIQRIVRHCRATAEQGFMEYEEGFDNPHEAAAIAYGLRHHGLWARAREWAQGKCRLIVKWGALDLCDKFNGPIVTRGTGSGGG